MNRGSQSYPLWPMAALAVSVVLGLAILQVATGFAAPTERDLFDFRLREQVNTHLQNANHQAAFVHGPLAALGGGNGGRQPSESVFPSEQPAHGASQNYAAPAIQSSGGSSLPWILLVCAVLLGVCAALLVWAEQRNRAATRKLRERDAQIAATLLSVGDGVIMTDATGKVLSINVAAEKMTGWSAAKAQGRSLNEVFHIIDEQTRRPASDALEEILPAYGEEAREKQAILSSRSGGERAIVHNAAPIRAADGGISGMVVTFKDASEGLHLEKELLRLNQTLEQRIQERAEMANREQMDWEGALDAAPDFIAILDVEGKILRANRLLAERLGQAQGDLVGKPYYASILGESMPPELCPHRRLLADGQPHTVQLNAPLLGGYVDAQALPLLNGANQLKGSIFIARDINAQRHREEQWQHCRSQIEKAVEESARELESLRLALETQGKEHAAQKLRAEEATAALQAMQAEAEQILKVSLDGFFLMDSREGRFLEVNDAYCRMTGYTPQELLDLRLFDVEAGESPVEAARHLQRIGEIGADVYESRLRGKDGTIIEVEISAKRAGLRGGVIAGFVKDITERKRDVVSLQQKTEELDKFFSLSLDLLCIADSDGYFRLLNKAWESVLGYGREELMKGSFLNFIHPDDISPTLAFIAELAAQQTVFGFVNRYRCKDGTYRCLEWHAAPAGKLIYATARDITAHRDLEESLDEARKVAEGSSRAKSDFLAAMSHELRTPLNAVIGFSEILADRTFGDLNSKQAKYVGNVLSAGRQLLNVVNNILDLSKMDAGKMDVEFSPVPVKQMLEDSLVLFREKFHRNGVCINVNAPDDLIVTVDEEKVRRVLLNLMSNAVKFSPNGGEICVTARPTEHAGLQQYVEIAVEDRGIGIRPEDQKRLFRPFEQLDSGPCRAHQGTGLGLALCRNFVEMHGGHIWVESEGEGKGSTFRFVLPMAQ